MKKIILIFGLIIFCTSCGTVRFSTNEEKEKNVEEMRSKLNGMAFSRINCQFPQTENTVYKKRN